MPILCRIAGLFAGPAAIPNLLLSGRPCLPRIPAVSTPGDFPQRVRIEPEEAEA